MTDPIRRLILLSLMATVLSAAPEGVSAFRHFDDARLTQVTRVIRQIACDIAELDSDVSKTASPAFSSISYAAILPAGPQRAFVAARLMPTQSRLPPPAC